MGPLEVCRWLEDTRGSVALHESIWVYPMVESIHVLTLCLFLGMTFLIDLRLLGASLTKTSVSQVYRRLAPWMVADFSGDGRSQRHRVSLHHIAHHALVGRGKEASTSRAASRRSVAGPVGSDRRMRPHDRL